MMRHGAFLQQFLDTAPRVMEESKEAFERARTKRD